MYLFYNDIYFPLSYFRVKTVTRFSCACQFLNMNEMRYGWYFGRSKCHFFQVFIDKFKINEKKTQRQNSKFLTAAKSKILFGCKIAFMIHGIKLEKHYVIFNCLKIYNIHRDNFFFRQNSSFI